MSFVPDSHNYSVIFYTDKSHENIGKEIEYRTNSHKL